MNILLVNPPTLKTGIHLDELQYLKPDQPSLPYYKRLLSIDESQNSTFSTFPGEHLGLQSLQSSLESYGYNVVVINACVELHTSLRQTLNKINEHHFDLIGFSGPLDVFSENLWIARRLREIGFTGHITLGHDFATLNHQHILTIYPEFDSVVRGEGEITIKELAYAIEHKISLHSVKGISFRENNKIIINPPRSLIDNLDMLPWVTRNDIQSVMNLRMSPSIFTKRGCPYQCSFCTTGTRSLAESLRGQDRWRQRSAGSVVDEIEFLVKEHNVNWVTIVDDLYISKGPIGSRHALEIANEIMDRGININYMIDCRIDSIDRDIFKILKKSGLRKVFIGIESSSEKALLSFNKGYKPGAIKSKLQILNDIGIDFIFGFILFNPLENLEGLEQSYNLLLDLDRYDFTLFLDSLRIYPGTPMHEKLEQMNLISGKFPYFSTIYENPYVGKISSIMNEFRSIALPAVQALLFDKHSDKDTVKAREEVYKMTGKYLGELIYFAKKGEENYMDMTYNKMLEEFLGLVSSYSR